MPHGTKEQIAAQRKRWKLKNPEKLKICKKRYYKNHPEKRRQEKRKYKKRYPEKHREAVRKSFAKTRHEAIAHYTGNTMACAVCGELHYEFLEIDHINGGGKQHRREINGNLCQWLKKNRYPVGFQVLCSNCNIKKVKIAAREHGTTGTKYQRKYYKRQERLKTDVFSHYTINKFPKCSCCGVSDPDALVIDHIDGNGSEHRRLIGKSMAAKFYKWLRKNNYPSGFQILCSNCNQSLGCHGYCPHQKEESGQLDPDLATE